MLRPGQYPVGTVLFERGDSADKFYLIHEGEVEVTTTPGDAFMARLGAGELLGEHAILSGGVRSGKAVVAADLVCTEIAASDLRALLNRQDTLIRPVVEALFLELALRNAIRISDRGRPA